VVRNGRIDNDATLERITAIALSQARAGADVIAPSGMMDGAVQAIRGALDANGFSDILTMPYSAKFASAYYGPFKRGTGSKPEVGLHPTHQINVANRGEALRSVQLDMEQGADMVIVKPALSSLDILAAVKRRFDIPVAAYQVSGELAMIRAAGELGLLPVSEVLLENLVCIKRAGADMIISYAAKEVATRLGDT
jgi:porphobilinogen synthase